MRSDVCRPWSQSFAVLVLIGMLGVFAAPSLARADDSTEDDADEATDSDDVVAKKPAPPPPVMPAKIDICMTSAAIAPTKSDGSPWDAGGAKLPLDEQKFAFRVFMKIVKLSRTNPAAVGTELALIFSRPAMQALAKPDVFGSIELAPKGAYTGKPGMKIPVASPRKPVREFTPGFGTSVCFKEVAWHPDLRLRVELTDKDLINDDKIGTVVLTSDNVRDAFAFGKPRHIAVGEQDTRQIHFVALEVTKSAEEEE